MNFRKYCLLILFATCQLISVSVFAAHEQVVKEYTTPPPAEEALPVSALPPLYTPEPTAVSASSSDSE